MAAGRPTKFTQKLADAICDRLADGESLRSICSSEGMPNKGTVCRWLADERNKEFRDQYAHAREAQSDALVDEIIDIADDGSNDWMKRNHGEDADASWVVNGEHVQRSKLRIDARKWTAEKLAPKKYGAKLDLNHNGGLSVTIAAPDAKIG